jgi:hypothetical protein
MSTSKPIHIFKPGTHTAMSGQALSFSEADLLASALAYDPALHEAPLVVGHPKADAPAYGWVKSLAFAETGLQALPHQVDAAFAELVSAGRFKKVSASFYTPDAAANPKPGVYYLRHVGFLGAQPPAIKGLKQAEFAESQEGIVEFSELDDLQNASLWRNLREWIIGKFGVDEADKTIPQYAVQQLEQASQDEFKQDELQTEAMDRPLPAFQEPYSGDAMSAEQQARLAELEAENQRLKQQQAEFAEQQQQAKIDADHASHLAFAEGLVQAGKLLPPQKDVTVALLDFMAGQDQAVEFGEGDAKKPLIDVVKADLLNALPKQIEFGELPVEQAATADTVNFAAPSGYVIATDRQKAHQRALAYMQQHHTDYLTAAAAVGA